MKKNYLIILVLSVFVFASCSETESEPSVININNDVRDSANIATQIQTLNDAGAFYNVSMKILNGTTPIDGAQVKLTSSVNGETIEMTENADASGNVVFDGITVGGNFIEVSAEGYYSALGIIDFKFERGYNYEIIDGVVTPITKSETAIIPLYRNGEGENTAKIKGQIKIETDVTNKVSEVLKNKLIRADFSGNIINVSEGLTFKEYSLNVEGGLGEDLTDDNGQYEIIVPTSQNGTQINLIIPQLQVKQKLAYLNEFDEPVLDSVLTTFGTNETSSSIPFVSGIKTIIPEPAEPGAGLQVTNIKKHPRRLFESGSPYYSPSSNQLFPGGSIQDMNKMKFKFQSGNGYKSVPEVVIEDATGANALVNAEGEYAIKSITLDSTGFYPSNTNINYDILAYYQSSWGTRSYYIYEGSVITNNSGEITQEALDESLEFAFVERDWFGERYRHLSNGEVDSIKINFDSYYYNSSRAYGTVDYDIKVRMLEILNPGDNYIDPSISFVGGDPITPATFEIIEFPTPWTFQLDNSNNTSPYVANPSINIEFLIDGTYDISNRIRTDETTYDFVSQVIKSKDGNIVFKENLDYFTYEYSIEQPEFYIIEPIHYKADVQFNIDENTGEINYHFDYNRGNGYKERFEVAVEPTFDEISGEGASFQVIGGSKYGDEYQWSGDLYIKNRGSGYVRNVNRINSRSFSISNDLSNTYLYNGDEVIVNIDYGTGRR